MSDDRIEAERLYVSKNWTMEAIAQKFSVNRRTIERWAKDKDWSAKKRANNVVSIHQERPVSDEPPIARVRRKADDIDELEIVTLALIDLSADLSMGGGEVDIRGKAAVAGALCKLIELRLKLKPRTAAEVADMAIALGLKPHEFANELRQRWQSRA